MADLPPATDADTPMRPDRGSPPSTPPPTPRWVKVFGIVAIVLVVVFVILHLAGFGFSIHTLP